MAHSDSDILDSDRLTPRHPRRCSPTQRKYIGALIVLLIIGLSVGLSVGLGVGLNVRQQHHSASTSPAPLPTLQPQNVSTFTLSPTLPSSPPTTRSFTFNISQVTGAPDGVSRPMLVVNGMYPGPTIEANQGDRLVVKVFNNMKNATSIHWHGLFQNGTNYYDGSSGITECGIPPGQSLTYNFTFGEFSGTTWWHALSTQYTDGITGALIVHPTPSSNISTSQNQTYASETVIQLADWYHTPSPDLLADYFNPSGIAGTPGNEPVPDSGVINGFGQYGSGGSYFNMTVESGKTYRLRLVNTGSFASIRFSVDNHPLTVIEADGTLIQPLIVSGVSLAVAQRYSVLITANQTAGNFWMRAEIDPSMFTYDVPGQNTDIRGVFKYSSTESSDVLPTTDPGLSTLPDLDTSLLAPSTPLNAPEATRSYPLTFSFGNTNEGMWVGFMNTTSWSPLTGTTTLLLARQASQVYTAEGPNIAGGDQLLVTEDSIQVVDLRIDNLDDGDHPFHLHGHRPWIVGAGPGRYTGQPLNNTNPMKRDTVVIPAYTWLVLRFITDNPGLWAFHCHIAWHMAAGLLMQINSLPSISASLDVPIDIVNQCSA